MFTQTGRNQDPHRSSFLYTLPEEPQKLQNHLALSLIQNPLSFNPKDHCSAKVTSLSLRFAEVQPAQRCAEEHQGPSQINLSCHKREFFKCPSEGPFKGDDVSGGQMTEKDVTISALLSRVI